MDGWMEDVYSGGFCILRAARFRASSHFIMIAAIKVMRRVARTGIALKLYARLDH